MEMRRVLICVALMAIVTYIPRVLPLTLFRKPIRSKYIRSFLDYTPYAVLGAMTFRMCFFRREAWRRRRWERRRLYISATKERDW